MTYEWIPWVILMKERGIRITRILLLAGINSINQIQMVMLRLLRDQYRIADITWKKHPRQKILKVAIFLLFLLQICKFKCNLSLIQVVYHLKQLQICLSLLRTLMKACRLYYYHRINIILIKDKFQKLVALQVIIWVMAVTVSSSFILSISITQI